VGYDATDPFFIEGLPIDGLELVVTHTVHPLFRNYLGADISDELEGQMPYAFTPEELELVADGE